MGLEIDRDNFSEQDFINFSDRLQQNLAAFRALLTRDGFGEGPYSIGAELEVYIVDEGGQPKPINERLRERHNDPQLTVELNRFNLEFDFEPLASAGAPLSRYVETVTEKLHALNQTAATENARILPIGILPTLKEDDFGPDVMTPTPRYRGLVGGLKRLRGGDVSINIHGDDKLEIKSGEITLEGATTSFQLHLKIPPREFVKTYNAMQLITPIVLAISANSPILFGRRLWHETRIALFKQSIDDRTFEQTQWRQPARVSFGHGWLRHSIAELFEEGARLHRPLLPLCADDDPLADVAAGLTPALQEMRLHQGTIWTWNRAVYDQHGDGHVRIELRALPAGPTPVDMLANAAFAFGLTMSLRTEIDALLPAIPFNLAEYNFYRAAQHGIDAMILWPERDQQCLIERPIASIATQLLERAADGLGILGMDNDEIQRHLGIVGERLRARQTGASWQRDGLQHRLRTVDRPEALRDLVNTYQENSARGLPVHEWALMR